MPQGLGRGTDGIVSRVFLQQGVDDGVDTRCDAGPGTDPSPLGVGEGALSSLVESAGDRE